MRIRFDVSLLALLFILVVGAAAAAGATDLVVTDVTADRVVANAGETIAVGARVVNVGGVAAGPSRLKYYFSADALLDPSDTYLNYDNVGALAGGAFEAETANVRVPAGTADGTYYVLFVADFDGDVVELDETNNVYALPVMVGELTLEDGPDLTVTDVALSAPRADAGAVVAASATVVNVGNEASAETRLKYYLSTDASYDAADTYLNYDVVAGLGPAAASPETANLRVPAGTPDGAYHVLFVADQTGVCAEADEGNNVASAPLFVGAYTPRADLQLEAVSVPVTTVRAGETIAVSAIAKNGGSADAGESRLLYFLSEDTLRDASDKQLSFDKVDALVVGGTSPEDANLRVSAATFAGNYYILFVLDADGVVDEADETNNVVAVAVTVTADDPDAIKPDLVLTGAALDATVATADGVLNASVTVENAGVADAGASRLKYFLSADDRFDAGDTYLNYDNVEALAVGAVSPQFAALRVPVGTPNGTHYVLFVADETRAVAERYESNNVVAIAFSVGVPETGGPGDNPGAPLPDYMVTSASVTATAVKAGERASLFCRVENVGEHGAVAASRVKYYLSRDTEYGPDDKYVGYDNVPALAAGEHSDEDATPMIDALTGHGRWYLLVVADAAGEVAETFESNNVSSIAIDVVVDDPSLDAPDLVAHGATLDKATVGAGLKLDVSATVQNAGTQPASSSRAKLYLSRDAHHDQSDVFLAYRQLDTLAVGASTLFSADVRVPMLTPEGPAFVLLVLDTERVMTERYESNNVLPIAVTVGEDDGPAPSYPYACPSSVFTDSSLLPRNTVASLNPLHLGKANNKDMVALACIVSHFDLVGLVEIFDPAGVASLEVELEALTGEAWSHHVSPTPVGNANGWEYAAFVWRDAEVELTSVIGFYDDPEDTIKREPYGANFAMGAIDFTFVVFHLQYGSTLATRRAEAAELIHVYDWFQAANGDEGDVLIGGDFNLPGNDSAFTLVGHDGVDYVIDPEQPTSIGYDGLASSFDNIFYPAGELTELMGAGAHDYTMANYSTVVQTVTDHLPVWIELDTSVDDD